MNLGIYDATVVYTIRSTTIVRDWALFRSWIDERRAHLDYPDLHNQLEAMAGLM